MQRDVDRNAPSVRPLAGCHHVRMAGHGFRGDLWKHDPDNPGSRHFITLPLGVADDLLAEAGPRHGFGTVRVQARIGNAIWHTSLFPDSSSGSLLLPVKDKCARPSASSRGPAAR